MSKPDAVHAVHKAGYAVTFDKFQFITINGAGHMVRDICDNCIIVSLLIK